MDIKITKPLAGDSPAEPFDVRQLKGALNRLGYYEPYEKIGMTGIPDAQMFTGLKQFQNDYGLRASGVIKPDDETQQALNNALSFADDGYYIWRTVGDDKVREGHATLNGHLRRWSDDPDPAQDYNCRCWAEPVSHERAQDLLGMVNPTISPLDLLIGPGAFGTKLGGRTIAAHLRDVSWIRNAQTSQIQHAFRHAKDFGVKGTQNKKTLSQFRKVLEDHIKSPDTKVIKGTFHNKKVTHYFNPKTNLNVIKDSSGRFRSG